MTGRVLEFKKKQPKVEKANRLRFFCSKCESDTFKLLQSCSVECAGCGALMNNLMVSSPDFPA
jgi:hypothetical protein